MSRWSEDNFGSDFASDYLTAILIKLVESINECLQISEHGTDLFYCGEDKLMPACDILVTLGKAYPYIVIPFLEDQPVAEWRDKYLKVFDQMASEVMGADNKQERRNVIITTFSDLINLPDQ